MKTLKEIILEAFKNEKEPEPILENGSEAQNSEINEADQGDFNLQESKQRTAVYSGEIFKILEDLKESAIKREEAGRQAP